MMNYPINFCLLLLHNKASSKMQNDRWQNNGIAIPAESKAKMNKAE